jgi:hypothetical protein
MTFAYPLINLSVVTMGGSLDFKWSSNTGAILVLPRGAAREELWNCDAYYRHAVQNSARWFDHACRQRETGDPGSLYFVTGHYKTSAYGLATVSDASDSASLKFSAIAPGFQSSAMYAYSWERCGTTIHRTGPVQPNDNKNQCVFASGLTITKKGMFGIPHFEKIKIADITGAKIKDPANPHSEKGPDPSNNNSGNAESEEPAPEDSDDIAMVVDDLSSTPQVRLFFHILYSI